MGLGTRSYTPRPRLRDPGRFGGVPKAAMPARKPTAKDLETFRGILERMRAALSGDINKLEADAFSVDGRRPAQDSLADSGSDSFAQEFSLELLQHDEESLGRVTEALERIEGGSFGRCEGCESWIARERLKAMPHASHCIECQRALEADS